MKPIAPALLAAAVLSTAFPAHAYVSAYTELDYDACTLIDSDVISAVLACPGHDGTPVQIVEADLRMTVSYGKNAAAELAASQGFSPFNHLGPRIEWLLDDTGTIRGTILRWFVAQGDETRPDHQVLVVTKVEAGNTCHVAYVDARANADANALARSAAEIVIPQFDCSGDRVQTWGNWAIPHEISPAL